MIRAPQRAAPGAVMRWLTSGAALFRRAPREWFMLIAAVFLIMKVTLVVHWVLGLIAVLVAPNFMAGLAHGCQAVADGKPLRPGYLASGFLKNGGALVVVGAVSLAGQILSAMLIYALAGEELKQFFALDPKALADSERAQQLEPLMSSVAGALLAGTALSLPVLLASWFSPMLVFFDDVNPLRAMVLSLWACLRNFGAFLLLGILILAGLTLLLPLGLRIGQLDLGLWLLAPILVPAVFVSYREIFPAEPAGPPPGSASPRE